MLETVRPFIEELAKKVNKAEANKAENQLAVYLGLHKDISMAQKEGNLTSDEERVLAGLLSLVDLALNQLMCQ